MFLLVNDVKRFGVINYIILHIVQVVCVCSKVDFKLILFIC